MSHGSESFPLPLGMPIFISYFVLEMHFEIQLEISERRGTNWQLGTFKRRNNGTQPFIRGRRFYMQCAAAEGRRNQLLTAKDFLTEKHRQRIGT